jgi:hypothetical protein
MQRDISNCIDVLKYALVIRQDSADEFEQGRQAGRTEAEYLDGLEEEAKWSDR